ncbi:MAG TPA: aspartyl protease family protein [Pyrinomonadaceae bacterium]|nr:aspartyl protease family protein [Pyrinomonadaceae bacterium]
MTLKLHKPKGISDLGLTHVAVNVRNPDSKESYTADFLVDTGAWHSMAPASELKRLGVKPLGSRKYELASGEFVEYQFGPAVISFLGELAVTEILFGPDNTEPILGCLALESAGFLVDPKNQMLRKLEALPLKGFGLKSVA